MPAALLGALSCGRCAHQQPAGDACERCGARWTPAAPGTVDLRGPTPFTGVIPAPRSRRVLAGLVDVLVLLVPGGLAGAAAAGSVRMPWLPLAAMALVLVAAQVGALTTRGQTLGRWLLGHRTVDGVTGTPVRPGRLARRMIRTGRTDLLTADLRLGRDPANPGLTTTNPAAESSSGRAAALAAMATARPAAPPGASSARPSVGIVLEGGERHEVADALLVGRSPADPTGGDRALLAWPDLSRRLAKTHVLLEWSGQVLSVTDLGSATGTTVVTPAGRQRLVPHARTTVPVGALIVCGGRSIKVVPHA